MINATAGNLEEFLKKKGISAGIEAVQTTGEVVKPPIEPINNAVVSTTDSLEKFTNLLESVNKLLNSPLISKTISKGVENKTGTSQHKTLEVPAGYLPPNTNGTSSGLPPPPPPKQENKREKAELFYDALLKSVEEMKKTDAKRTIAEIYEELAQEETKEKLINQMEILI